MQKNNLQRWTDTTSRQTERYAGNSGFCGMRADFSADNLTFYFNFVLRGEKVGGSPPERKAAGRYAQC